MIDTSSPDQETQELSGEQIRAVIAHRLINGDPNDAAAAIRSGAIDPDDFGHNRPLIEAVIGLVNDDIRARTPTFRDRKIPASTARHRPTYAGAVYERMLHNGTSKTVAQALILDRHGFDVASAEAACLDYWLARLAAHREDELLRMQVAELMATLDRPGGRQRVKQLLAQGGDQT